MYQPAPALHMLSFENFVKSMPQSLSELKVTPSFCFAFKIPDDVTASNVYMYSRTFFGSFLNRPSALVVESYNVVKYKKTAVFLTYSYK